MFVAWGNEAVGFPVWFLSVVSPWAWAPPWAIASRGWGSLHPQDRALEVLQGGSQSKGLGAPQLAGGEGQESLRDAHFQEKCRTAVTIPGAQAGPDPRMPGAEQGARLGPEWG